MGLASGSSILYRVLNISLDEVKQVIRSRIRANHPDHTMEELPIPTIDLDASWIVRSCNNTTGSQVGYLCRLAMFIASNGFNVVIVCDGNIRHHSKRSTIKRHADCYRDMITIRKNRVLLNDLHHRYEESNDVSERELIQKEKETLLSRTTSLERKKTQANVSVGEDMYQQVKQQVTHLLENVVAGLDIPNITVMQAEFQADAVMAARLVSEETNLLLCSDSDLAALTGNQYIAIKSFKFIDSAKKSSLKELELSVTNEYNMATICRILNIEKENKNEKRLVKYPKYAIFDGIDDPKLYVLIAIGLGTDFYIGGVHGIGPKAIHDFILKNKNRIVHHPVSESDTFNALIQFFLDKYKKEKEKTRSVSDTMLLEYERMIRVYVDTIYYEPANITSTSIQENVYIHDSPTYLHPYISAFARNDPNIVTCNTIDSSFDLLMCVGPHQDQQPHPFFRLDGEYSKCKCCQETICRTCTFTCIDNKQNYCVRCYAKETLIGEMPSISNLPSKKEMMDELRKKGLIINHDDPLDFIMDLYEAVTNDGSLFSEDQLSNIKYPLERSCYLQDIVSISDLLLKQGGSFINNNDLSLNENLEIVNILIDLVDVTKIHSALFPKMIISFAAQCRLHVGERLLKRTLLHAMDNDNFDLRESEGKIVMYKNEVSVYIKHKMRASMRDITYNVEVLFNRIDLVACQCDCKVGSCGEERVVCIHIFPVIYQLYLLMYEGLANNIIEELAHYSTSSVDTFDNETNTKMLTFIHRLFLVIGYEHNGHSTNVSEILETFKVGTDRPKFGPGKVKSASKNCPARQLDMRSNAKRSLDQVEKKETTVSEVNESTIPISEGTTIYKSTYNLMTEHIMAMCFVLKADNSFLYDRIGYDVILYRSKYNNWDDVVISTEKKKVWKDLIERANNRSKVSEQTDTPVVEDNQQIISTNHVPIINSDNDAVPKQQQGVARYTCCYCGSTSNNDSSLTFRRVPTVVGYKKKKTNAIRFSYYKKQFRRNVFLNRMNIPGIRRKLNGLRYCSKHTTKKESFDIPWIDCDRVKKTKTAILDVFVSEDDTEVIASEDDAVDSSLSPSLTVGSSLDNNDDAHFVSNILIEMSNMNNNDDVSETLIEYDVVNELNHHILPNNNILSQSSSDSSFCLSSRDEEGNESLFGSSDDSSNSIEENNNNNNNNNENEYCIPVSEKKK